MKSKSSNVFKSSIFFFSLLLLPLFLTQNVFAQYCDDCSRPNVAVYDFDLQIARPQTDSLILKWMNLFWPGIFATSALRANEPKSDCITWFDGAVLNAKALEGIILVYGPEYLNLPPDGPLTSSDYILSGFTRELNGHYESALTLEAAYSREMVKSVSIEYENTQTNISEVGKDLAVKFGSIWDVIKDFERFKRDTDNEVAIRDLWTRHSNPEIVLTPEKQKVEPNETIDIELEMIDCDGVPLGNRQIFFADTTIMKMKFNGTTGGIIDPPIVNTDANGKATVKFTAGNSLGIANISAFFPHKRAYGVPDGFLENTIVVIGKPPVDKWILNVKISEQFTRSIDTSWTDGNNNGSFRLHEKFNGTAFISGLVKNESLDSMFYAVYGDENGYPIENCIVSGFGNIDYFEKYYLNWADPLPDVDIENCIYRGIVEPGSTEFEFHYPTEPGEIVITARSGGVAEGSMSWIHSVYFPERKIEKETNNSSSFFSVGAVFLDGECTVTKTDSSYFITGFQTDTIKEETSSGMETTESLMKLKAVLTSNGSLTGVKREDNHFPFIFSLAQNYPNPFNPTTMIKYSVPSNQYITLQVFDVLGNEVATLVNEQKSAGTYEVKFNAGHLSSGIYLYRIYTSDGMKMTKKLMLIK
ncbi:MAG: hypothetical protein COW71_05625 [Ignavibacteriales bacterium CG18_big_fil_WC_8_21_14_2_50_31_20]|nr:MAG: hypothetical protein COW71_05625 [Ignavibacteriales bacterium CG18_big_fil_WC_8_21_14_2_50_31_20]